MSSFPIDVDDDADVDDDDDEDEEADRSPGWIWLWFWPWELTSRRTNEGRLNFLPLPALAPVIDTLHPCSSCAINPVPSEVDRFLIPSLKRLGPLDPGTPCFSYDSNENAFMSNVCESEVGKPYPYVLEAKVGSGPSRNSCFSSLFISLAPNLDLVDSLTEAIDAATPAVVEMELPETVDAQLSFLPWASPLAPPINSGILPADSDMDELAILPIESACPDRSYRLLLLSSFIISSRACLR
jgi:hypothetical protein